MQEIIIDIVNRFGYFGIFFLITVENVFPPIPSEIILTFGGFMTTHSDMFVWGVVVAATVGSVLGACILYFVGRLLNAERIERILGGRMGRMLHLRKDDVRRAEKWFVNHGKRAVFFCRFVPIVRSLISVPAGSSKMKFEVFLPLTIAGTLIWNIVLVLLGRMAGDAWATIAEYVDVYSLIALAALLCIAAVVGLIFIKKRFLNNR